MWGNNILSCEYLRSYSMKNIILVNFYAKTIRKI